MYTCAVGCLVSFALPTYKAGRAKDDTDLIREINECMKYTQADVKNLSPELEETLRSNYDKEARRYRKGLLLTGGTGSGKTYALHAANIRIRELGGYSNVSDVENWVELLFELKDKINGGHVRAFLETVTNRNSVFLDDVGAEKVTEWSQEMMYLIVNRAYENGSTIFISTNLSLEEFTEKYGDRITSRLVEMCSVINLGDEDRRLA